MALNLTKRPTTTVADSPATSPVTRRAPTPTNGNSASAGKSASFIRSASVTNRRLIVSIEGEEKSGKSHTALTAPEPIYYHSFDIGLEGVISKFDKDKAIFVAEYELTIQPGEASANEVADAADKVWEQFVANYRDSIESTKQGGTIVWDSSTECWELLRLARFGKLTQIMPHMYTSVNAEMRDLIRESYAGTNMAHLVKRVDQYENYTDSQGREKGRKTGLKEPKQFKDLPFLVQTVAVVERSGSSDFQLTIKDCRQNPEVNEQVIPNDFEFLLSAVFGD
jgi:hypothetical protein